MHLDLRARIIVPLALGGILILLGLAIIMDPVRVPLDELVDNVGETVTVQGLVADRLDFGKEGEETGARLSIIGDGTRVDLVLDGGYSQGLVGDMVEFTGEVVALTLPGQEGYEVRGEVGDITVLERHGEFPVPLIVLAERPGLYVDLEVTVQGTWDNGTSSVTDGVRMIRIVRPGGLPVISSHGTYPVEGDDTVRRFTGTWTFLENEFGYVLEIP